MLPCRNQTSSTVASVMSADVRGKVLSPLCSILVVRVEFMALLDVGCSMWVDIMTGR
jgi:hypothetical protein